MAFILTGYPTAQDDSAAYLAIGFTQAVAAARAANRGDASAALGGTALGTGGAVAVNPMVVNESALHAYSQPNPAPPATVPVPSRHLDAMQVSTKPSNYVQPSTGNP